MVHESILSPGVKITYMISNAANDFREKKSRPSFEKFTLILLDPIKDILYIRFTTIDSYIIPSVIVEI